MTSLEQTLSCIRINIFNCKHVFKEAGCSTAFPADLLNL